jgi:hypothetical protein
LHDQTFFTGSKNWCACVIKTFEHEKLTVSVKIEMSNVSIKILDLPAPSKTQPQTRIITAQSKRHYGSYCPKHKSTHPPPPQPTTTTTKTNPPFRNNAATQTNTSAPQTNPIEIVASVPTIGSWRVVNQHDATSLHYVRRKRRSPPCNQYTTTHAHHAHDRAKQHPRPSWSTTTTTTTTDAARAIATGHRSNLLFQMPSNFFHAAFQSTH